MIKFRLNKIKTNKIKFISVGGLASFSDDFTRADSTDLGVNWTEAAGDQEILTNTLNLNTVDFAKNLCIFSGTPCNTISQFVKVTIILSGTAYPHIVLRYKDSSSPYYSIEPSLSTNLSWYRSDNAAAIPTAVDAGNTLAFSSGDSIGVTITGIGNDTIIRVWSNPIANIPDSPSSWDGSPADATFLDDVISPVDEGFYVGLQGFRAVNLIQFTNFKGGDIPNA